MTDKPAQVSGRGFEDWTDSMIAELMEADANTMQESHQELSRHMLEAAARLRRMNDEQNV
jgi:hypothetical protein